MNFDSLISCLQKEDFNSLPGEEAQFELSPLGRPNKAKALKAAKDIKESAVLLHLFPIEGKSYLSLILRNTYPGVHSGQIGFPGGKKEEKDADFLETALRETEEELGLKRSNLETVGHLSDLFIPPSNFLVQPFIAFSSSTPNFKPDPREVQKHISFPVEHLMDDKNTFETSVLTSFKNMKIQTKAIAFEEHIIWGATAMMLSEFKALLNRNEL